MLSLVYELLSGTLDIQPKRALLLDVLWLSNGSSNGYCLQIGMVSTGHLMGDLLQLYLMRTLLYLWIICFIRAVIRKHTTKPEFFYCSFTREGVFVQNFLVNFALPRPSCINNALHHNIVKLKFTKQNGSTHLNLLKLHAGHKLQCRDQSNSNLKARIRKNFERKETTHHAGRRSHFLRIDARDSDRWCKIA